MARGTGRTPSQAAYRGALGRTQTTTVYVTGPRGELVPAEVYTTIDAVSDPELAERLHADDPLRRLNVVPNEGAEPVRVDVPVLYHDPAAELLVLVLDAAHRHRELEERIAVYEQLLADRRVAIPRYAKEFAVVYGGQGLRDYLERRAHAALEVARLSSRELEHERARGELDKREAELDFRARELDAAAAELARAREALDRSHSEPEPIEDTGDHANAIDFEQTGRTSDALTTHATDLARHDDAWLERAARSPGATFGVANGVVRLVLGVGEPIARELGGALDLRIMLLRTARYPVIAVAIGEPSALRSPHPGKLALATLDVANDSDHHVLAALARRFELVVDVVVRGVVVREVKLTAPLGENVNVIMRAAEDHLRGVHAEDPDEPPGAAGYERAVRLVRGAGYDVLGASHPDSTEFRDELLGRLQTAQQVRRAIAIARRFSRPSGEDYLVCTRGFALPRWRALRQRALEAAVGWGLWIGPELVQVAVGEGLARSRRDLIVKLGRNFEALRRHPTAYDLDADATADNLRWLAEEASQLGVDLDPPRTARSVAIASDASSEASGLIGATTGHDVPQTRVEQLVALLDDRDRRVAAAIELCERGDGAAAAPVIAAVKTMSRAEAVRVLGMAVKFGAAAKAPLLEGLTNSKAFLRHGCALALALLRTEDGTQAVIDLLLGEPTEIWREVARAIGQIGSPALLPLASTFGRLGARAEPATAERVAWAMAHVAVRGGKSAVETMAAGHSLVAPVAKRALDLHASAADDQIRARSSAEGSQPGRDVTVNRAFSRRFFEALEHGVPEAGKPGLVDLEASNAMELLDETDLIEEDEL